jgi:hypothetical protein
MRYCKLTVNVVEKIFFGVMATILLPSSLLAQIDLQAVENLVSDSTVSPTGSTAAARVKTFCETSPVTCKHIFGSSGTGEVQYSGANADGREGKAATKVAKDFVDALRGITTTANGSTAIAREPGFTVPRQLQSESVDEILDVPNRFGDPLALVNYANYAVKGLTGMLSCMEPDPGICWRVLPFIGTAMRFRLPIALIEMSEYPYQSRISTPDVGAIDFTLDKAEWKLPAVKSARISLELASKLRQLGLYNKIGASALTSYNQLFGALFGGTPTSNKLGDLGLGGNNQQLVNVQIIPNVTQAVRALKESIDKSNDLLSVLAQDKCRNGNCVYVRIVPLPLAMGGEQANQAMALLSEAGQAGLSAALGTLGGLPWIRNIGLIKKKYTIAQLKFPPRITSPELRTWQYDFPHEDAIAATRNNRNRDLSIAASTQACMREVRMPSGPATSVTGRSNAIASNVFKCVADAIKEQSENLNENGFSMRDAFPALVSPDYSQASSQSCHKKNMGPRCPLSQEATGDSFAQRSSGAAYRFAQLACMNNRRVNYGMNLDCVNNKKGSRCGDRFRWVEGKNFDDIKEHSCAEVEKWAADFGKARYKDPISNTYVAVWYKQFATCTRRNATGGFLFLSGNRLGRNDFNDGTDCR